MMRKCERRSQRGVGLLQLALGMALAVSLAVGSIAMYGNVQRKQYAAQLFQEFKVIHEAIESLYRNRPGYDGFSIQVLANSGALPSAMVSSDSGGSVWSATRARLNVDPVRTSRCPTSIRPNCYDGYIIKIWNITPTACKDLAGRIFPGNPYQISIGSSMLAFYAPRSGASPQLTDVEAMKSACERVDGNGETDFRVSYIQR